MRHALCASLVLGWACACGATPPSVREVDLDPDRDHSRGDADACPLDAEDEDGRHDEDGCPDLDDDADGIADADDLCPCDVEDVDEWQDADGCPDPDNDGDRLVDVCDLCPNEAEVYNGRCDEDGCPDRSHVCVEQMRIRILEYVYFARGSSTPSPSSTPLLDAIVATLDANPQLTLVAIVGEAEPRERRRQGLAMARAQAVLDTLVAAGVVRERLVAEADPAPVHDPSEAPDHWRRVRFVIRAIAGEAYDQDAPLEPRCGGTEGPSSCEVPVCTVPPPVPPAC